MSLQIWKTFISLPISFSFSFEKNNQNSDRRHQFVYTVLYIPTNRSVFCVLLLHLLALFNCHLMFVVCSRFFLIACTKITKTLKMYGQAIHVSLSVFLFTKSSTVHKKKEEILFISQVQIQVHFMWKYTVLYFYLFQTNYSC